MRVTSIGRWIGVCSIRRWSSKTRDKDRANNVSSHRMADLSRLRSVVAGDRDRTPLIIGPFLSRSYDIAALASCRCEETLCLVEKGRFTLCDVKRLSPDVVGHRETPLPFQTHRLDVAPWRWRYKSNESHGDLRGNRLPPNPRCDVTREDETCTPIGDSCRFFCLRSTVQQ
ncbi:hypothetical protein K491DRAFT_476183 [Lophiostoma macrostomum CBS 122681]|uniref:Uncharacterized protein n=1 Tax=Lophiostoma macrostomum CBS 122681 TaxID=1314788 RepID=A0A6A6T659_9PLEO|nr:hypothetical protein K491DRAFT_476183 [Lophiostoma macrostomum CBS 122681]